MRGMDSRMLPKKPFTLSMGMGSGYINGQVIYVTPYTTMSTVGTWEVWKVKNPTAYGPPVPSPRQLGAGPLDHRR